MNYRKKYFEKKLLSMKNFLANLKEEAIKEGKNYRFFGTTKIYLTELCVAYNYIGFDDAEQELYYLSHYEYTDELNWGTKYIFIFSS